MPVTGANNGLELYDLRGADYDDPQWDKLLDQVTVDEMDGGSDRIRRIPEYCSRFCQ